MENEARPEVSAIDTAFKAATLLALVAIAAGLFTVAAKVDGLAYSGGYDGEQQPTDLTPLVTELDELNATMTRLERKKADERSALERAVLP